MPRALLFLFLACAPLSTSCRNVEYWEKEHFSDPVMTYQPDGTLTHFDQKVFHSIEGAAGGFGASAGGGCGCN